MPDENNLIDTLKTAAIAMHELYLSLTAAGFTETQALYIIVQGMRPQPKEGF